MKQLTLMVVVLGLVVAGGILLMKANHNKSTTETVSVDTVLVPPTQASEAPVVAKKQILNITVSNEQIVVLAGPIMENAYEVASEISVKALNKKPLYLLINSPGGSVLDGALIIDAMQAAKVPVNTVCMQLCASMGAIIHQHGTKRYALDRSLLMFHNASAGFQGELPHIKAQFDNVERYVAKFNAYIANRSGNDYNAFINEVNRNIWIDAEDSLSRGFVDNIVFVMATQGSTPVAMESLLTPPLTPSIDKASPASPDTTQINPFKTLQ